MNQSASTLTGRTKIKIVLLGNQSVGKSSIIERYIKNVFEETANVHVLVRSPQSESIFWSKTSPIKTKTIGFNSGTLLDRKDLEPSSPTI